jgi:hypothetical protein
MNMWKLIVAYLKRSSSLHLNRLCIIKGNLANRIGDRTDSRTGYFINTRRPYCLLNQTDFLQVECESMGRIELAQT